MLKPFRNLFKKNFNQEQASLSRPNDKEPMINVDLSKREHYDHEARKLLELKYIYDDASSNPSFSTAVSPAKKMTGKSKNRLSKEISTIDSFALNSSKEISTKAFLISKHWVHNYRFYFKQDEGDWSRKVFETLTEVFNLTTNHRDASYVDTFQYVRNQTLQRLAVRPMSVHAQTNSETIFFYDKSIYLNDQNESSSPILLQGNGESLKLLKNTFTVSKLFICFDYEKLTDVGHGVRVEKTTRYAQLVSLEEDHFVTCLNGEYRSYNYSNSSNIFYYEDPEEIVTCVKVGIRVIPHSANIHKGHKVLLKIS